MTRVTIERRGFALSLILNRAIEVLGKRKNLSFPKNLSRFKLRHCYDSGLLILLW
jgi:hypothetical protein